MSVLGNLSIGAVALACLCTGALASQAAHPDRDLYAVSVYSREDFARGDAPTFRPHIGTKKEVELAAKDTRKANPRRDDPSTDAIILVCKVERTYDGLFDPEPPSSDADRRSACIQY